MKTHLLIPQWGRIKAASLPIGYLKENPNWKVQEILTGKNPQANLWYFPRIGNSLRHALQRQPLRSYISTHQWMPWNFFPFIIGSTDWESLFHYSGWSFEAVLEPKYAEHIRESTVLRFQNALKTEDFRNAFEIINTIPTFDRSQQKWRAPFFICRPSHTQSIATLDSSCIPQIDAKVELLLEDILQWCEVLYRNVVWSNIPSEYREMLIETLLYFQLDVHIPKSWEPIIEWIQMPDVWFFLETFSDNGSLQDIKDINRKLRHEVINTIEQTWKNKLIFLTWKNVIQWKEDVLEQRELQVMQDDLEKRWIHTYTESVDDFSFDPNRLYILMNFEYTDSIRHKLFALAARYPQNFSPNPFLQYLSKDRTGYTRYVLQWKNAMDVLRGITFENGKISEEVFYQRVDDYFWTLWIHPMSRILQFKRADGQVLYVYRDSLYSLRKIKWFLENEQLVSIIEVPHQDGTSMIQKDGFDVLHTYRFMYAKR